MKHRLAFSILSSGIVALALPAATFAASATAIPRVRAEEDAMQEDIVDILDETTPAAVPAQIMDGRGGAGGGSASMSIYPGSPGGVLVEASVTREVTPDYISINAYCDTGKMPNRELARDALNQIFQDIKDAVGNDGRIRRSGGVSVYPVYEKESEEIGSYSGNMSLTIRILKKESSGRIYDYVEDKGCGPNWDVRLVDTLPHEMKSLDELTDRLNKRKTVFEKLLNRKLTRVLSASLNSWVDGFGTYDPETNTADATTTLSVTFDPGTRAMLPSRIAR